jgi:hypothetical protein
MYSMNILKRLIHTPISVTGKMKVLKKYLYFKRQFRTLPEWDNVGIKLNGDSSASAVEPFTHYDAFYYWIARDISYKKSQKILDIGGKKVINGWLSVMNEVTSVNLVTPVDGISNVKYVAADATKRLPFNDEEFDVFISPVSLNLIGLGRYGDNVDPNAIPNLILDLSRCMKQNSVMYISMVFGEDQVLFNHHFVLSLATIKKLFANWQIEEYLIDNQNLTSDNIEGGGRFSGNLQLTVNPQTERIIFLKLVRA